MLVESSISLSFWDELIILWGCLHRSLKSAVTKRKMPLKTELWLLLAQKKTFSSVQKKKKKYITTPVRISLSENLSY